MRPHAFVRVKYFLKDDLTSLYIFKVRHMTFSGNLFNHVAIVNHLYFSYLSVIQVSSCRVADGDKTAIPIGSVFIYTLQTNMDLTLVKLQLFSVMHASVSAH